MGRRAAEKAYSGLIRWGIVLGLMNLALLLFLVFWPDPVLRGWVSDIGGIVIPITAAGCCFGFHRSASRQRLSSIQHLPATLGGAALCYGAGMTLFTLETRYLGWSGNPGWGDLFFLFQYGFFIAATVLWPSKRLPSSIRWRTWSDALILLLALSAFGWIGFIGPTVLEATEGTLGTLGREASAAPPATGAGAPAAGDGAADGVDGAGVGAGVGSPEPSAPSTGPAVAHARASAIASRDRRRLMR